MELHILYTKLRKADFIEMGWGLGVVAKISSLVFGKVVLKAIFINALRYVTGEKIIETTKCKTSMKYVQLD